MYPHTFTLCIYNVPTPTQSCTYTDPPQHHRHTHTHTRGSPLACQLLLCEPSEYHLHTVYEMTWHTHKEHHKLTALVSVPKPPPTQMRSGIRHADQCYASLPPSIGQLITWGVDWRQCSNSWEFDYVSQTPISHLIQANLITGGDIHVTLIVMLITPTKSCIIDVNLYPHSQAVKNVSEGLETGQRCTIYSVKTGPFQCTQCFYHPSVCTACVTYCLNSCLMVLVHAL